MSEGTKRRLAAIVAADVVGYSRLMGADETGTLATLRAHRSDLIDPLIDRHGGRIVKTTGDGLLLEFPSVARQPNDADAHTYRGLVLALSGQPELGIEPVDHAIRLNPQFVNGPYLNLRGIVMIMAQDFEVAVRSCEENIARQGPVAPPVLAWAIAAYWALGRRDDAERTVALLATRFPAFRLKNWNFFKLIQSPDDRRRLHDLMCTAGVPE